jgi:hypothetical protein
MITFVWETELSPYGKDKDSIISPLATQRLETSIKFKMLTTQLILKVYGHTFTIHSVLMRIKLLHSFNMATPNQSKLFTRLLMLPQNMLDSC